ncbi:MAG TPA: S8 family peptidase [Mobilitalea sp.]|nr:S8 family peptidase [Mobilitalea sp.]
MMTPEIREQMISEEYADLLIQYSGDMTIFDAFPGSGVHIINFLYAIVHVPVATITTRTIVEMGYIVMPKCYGIVSNASLEASGVLRIRNIPDFDLRGQGVLIGIIDTGVDYTNPIFQYADGTTRIAAIWDQTIQSESVPISQGYGTVYSREQINEALQSENPLDIVPSTDTNGHGTMVAGIAGGNRVADMDFSGVATDAEFAVVKLKQAKQYLRDFFFIPDGVECFQETDILFALGYLLELIVTLQKPMVICICLGSSQGSHDSRELLSSFLSMIGNRPGLAIVVAAGNEGNSRRHYFGTVNPVTGYDTVELNIGANVAGFSMELWGRSPSLFSLDILSPSGEYVPRIVAGMDENRVISFIFEGTTLFIDYQIIESQIGDQLILIRFANPSEGIWRFNVYERGDLKIGFHIWLPMGDFIPEDVFFIRSDPYTTILNPGNAYIPITTTAYNIADDSLYINASRGYTRTEAIKPELAAPGVNITGPDIGHGFTTYTGTSVAAAHTAGVAAMIMEWGIIKGNLPGMSTVGLKNLLIRGARRDIDIVYPNRDWGYGILDVFSVFDSLRTGIVL